MGLRSAVSSDLRCFHALLMYQPPKFVGHENGRVFRIGHESVFSLMLASVKVSLRLVNFIVS